MSKSRKRISLSVLNLSVAKKSQASLFEVVEIEEDKEKKVCPHRHEIETDTDWGAPWGVRMTATCKACGSVRGRTGSLND